VPWSVSRWLADEPTGNLDSAATADVLHLFDSLHRAGHTMVIVTHDARVAGTADRLISMRDGVFVDDTGPRGGALGRLYTMTGREG
jgi:ABC-type lipoprotein export system ATPase subunit